jgi:hypothetical protein
MKLGNLVEKITTYTGIKWLVKKITKIYGIEDCGCDRRKEKWNEIEINRLDKWIK